MQELAREVGTLLGPSAAALLGEVGAPSIEALLRTVPERILARLLPEDRPARALAAVRDLASARDDLRVAIAVTRHLARIRVAAAGPEHPDSLLEAATLGALALRAGREEGGPVLEDAWHKLRSVAGGRDPRVAVVAQSVAAHLVREGRLEEAETALETAYRIRRAHQPETVVQVAAQLGEVRLQLGKHEEALPLLLEAHQLTAAREGADAPRTLARAQAAGACCNALERWTEAVALLRPVYASLGPADDAERRATVGFELGLALDRTGVVEESRRRIEEALRLTRQLGEAGGEPHPQLADRLKMMARVHIQRGRLGEAEGLLLEGLEAQRRLFGAASAEVGEQQAELGRFCLAVGRADEAVGWFDAATSLLSSALGATHPETMEVVEEEVRVLQDLATAALGRRDKELAGAMLHRALDLASRTLGHAHGRTRAVRDLLAKHRLG